MVKGKFVLAAATVAAASLSLLAGTSQAVVYTEGPGDAGQTLATAQVLGANVTGITGTIGANQDADLYKFTLAAGQYTFSTDNAANIDATAGGQLDTAIFLLSSTGTALVTNDDANGSTFASTLTYTVATAGTYYFGISLSGNEPVNSNNQLLFAGYPGGDTTATRGPASGLNPTTEATFDGQSYSSDLGSYGVTVTAAAVPEPSTWAVIAASSAALFFLRRRRLA